MTPKKFYVQLTVISGVVALSLVLLNSYQLITSHQSFSWISWGFFILFSIVLFFVCSKSAKSENKNLFGQVFLLSIFFKMLFCASMVIAFVLIAKPETVHFILPFLFIYLVYTTYEVYFVTKLAKP
ncbi:hypothetical protein [Aureispira anguillae]|uniref:Uncharacterized protein n=1 Tax=Aureispira anguillae TaxID=2864201 RepID=A0A915YFQ3_9BACT|nr:hypothetical protein [Aureispira anguillae]BDS12166.1 hypothetical protein AsAng_0028810 [Aureispira anguillae]